MSERARAFAPGVLFLALQAGLVLASQYGGHGGPAGQGRQRLLPSD